MSEATDIQARLARLDATMDRQRADDALAGATVDVEFVNPHAKSQALALLRSGVKVDGDRAIAADGRPVGEYVADRLSQPEFGHFVKASRGGGTALSGFSGGTAPGHHHVEAPAPRTLGEHVIQVTMAARANRPSGDPRDNMRLPFGLRGPGR